MAKKQTAVDPANYDLDYEVLIPCSNDKTGKRYAAGDVVTHKDFDTAVIRNWLEIDPPVLRVRSAD